MKNESRIEISILTICAMLAGAIGAAAMIAWGIVVLNQTQKAINSGEKALVQMAEFTQNFDEFKTRLLAIETKLPAAASSAESALTQLSSHRNETREAFASVGSLLGQFKTDIEKLETDLKAVATESSENRSIIQSRPAPAVARPDEYIIKAGDGGTKIARTFGVSIQDLQAVNPGVNWNRLVVGQKIRIPVRR